MPLVLPAQQYYNIPHLPTPPNYNQYQSRGSGWRKSEKVTPSVNFGGRADSLKNGLPTPPSDMTGVSFNTAVSSNYGVKPHNNVYNNAYPSTTSHLFSNTKANAFTQATVPVTRQNTNHNTTLSVPKPAAPQREMADQKKTNKSSGSTASYLQIPSSINDSKGNLAEFAAQVRLSISVCFHSHLSY